MAIDDVEEEWTILELMHETGLSRSGVRGYLRSRDLKPFKVVGTIGYYSDSVAESLITRKTSDTSSTSKILELEDRVKWLELEVAELKNSI